jgi:hypothetical protein
MPLVVVGFKSSSFIIQLVIPTKTPQSKKNNTMLFGKPAPAKKNDNPNAVVPVYLKSKDHCWVPALQLKTFNGKATVAVPRITKEEELLHCSNTSKQFRFDNQVVNLADYKDGIIPMQNVDHRGNLEDYKDMVDLPFMHEVGRFGVHGMFH